MIRGVTLLRGCKHCARSLELPRLSERAVLQARDVRRAGPDIRDLEAAERTSQPDEAPARNPGDADVEAPNTGDVLEDPHVSENRASALDDAHVRARSSNLHDDTIGHREVPQGTCDRGRRSTECSQDRMSAQSVDVGRSTVAPHDQQRRGADPAGHSLLHDRGGGQSGRQDTGVESGGHGPHLEPVEAGEFVSRACRDPQLLRDLKGHPLGARVLDPECFGDRQDLGAAFYQFSNGALHLRSIEPGGHIDECMQGPQ